MNPLKLLAIVLIAAGIVALAYGGFTYTKATHEARIGPFEMTITDKQTVNVPVWAGIAAIVSGGVVLLAQKKK
jgi:uncharacterized membrane protein YidH (DUF202 family)